MKRMVPLMKALLCWCVLCEFARGVRAQFPRACSTVEAIESKRCCPSPSADAEDACGARSGRGACDTVRTDTRPWGGTYTLRNVDDRERWPTKFYTQTCTCFGNFAGYDCGECKFGWTGPNCNLRKPPVTRKNIMSLSVEERQIFLEALQRSKRTVHPQYVIATEHWLGLIDRETNQTRFSNISVYDLFVWQHYYSVRDTLLGPGRPFKGIDFSHKGPAFITWHRYHLLSLERDLQKLIGDENFAIPYWNFATGGSECDVCTDELLGGEDPSDPSLISPRSPFSDWGIVCNSLDDYNRLVTLCNGTREGPLRRGPKERGNITLPTKDDVHSCLQLRDFDRPPYLTNSTFSFRNTLEGFDKSDGELESAVTGLHNLVHDFLSGTNALSHSAANDPIFVVLHAFTDAIFEEWLRRFPKEDSFPEEMAPIGHNRHFNMVPFFPPVTNEEIYIPSVELGYSYEIDLADAGQSSAAFVVAGSCLALLVLILLLVLYARQRRRREYEPLVSSGYAAVKYTEDA
ncbi:L-dopachrome tautomerase [Ictalurus furcatus]|uniref:L-dopachrome tautomerase n=1 Tax=Ictalurus furcatus TaxID=66913 RepID=UPI002350835E|nr:L-dopachrome tautomerase [Ictalurus furcatus]